MMELRDYYFEELKGLTSDLYKDYQNKLQHYYELYVQGKMEEGMSRREVLEGMASPDKVSQRWHLYAKLDGLKGVKKKGAWTLLGEAREQGLLLPKYYYGGLGVMIVKIVTFPLLLLLIFGAMVLVNPAIGTFVVSTIISDNPGVMLIAMLAFVLFLLYGSIRYALKFVSYFLEDMIDRTVSGADLKDFSKERYTISIPKPKNKRTGKDESIDRMIRE
jgi:hypothetical protein